MKIIKVKNYAEAEKKCLKGFRIPYIWQLIKLIQEGEAEKFFKYEKGKDRYFLTKQSKRDVKKKIVRGLLRDRDGDWDAGWYGVLDCFGDYCRVVYLENEETKSIEGKEISIMAEGYDKGFEDGKAEAKLEFERFLEELRQYHLELNAKLGALIVSRNIKLPSVEFINKFEEKLKDSKEGEKA